MKLFLTDLDGTLLDHRGQLSSYSRSGLATLLQARLPFSVATARGWPGTRRVLGDLDLALPVIVRNGAYIVDYQNGNILQGHHLDQPLAERILAFFRDRGHSPAVAVFKDGKEHMYGETPRSEPMEAYAMIRRYHQDPSWTEIDNLDTVVSEPVAQFNLIAEGEEILACRDALALVFGDAIQCHTYERALRPGWRMLSILASKATKGNAALWLLNHLNLPADVLTAFGDNHNDISMLKVAGVPIVVGHARKEVTAFARIILETGNPDSVVDYLRANWK